MARVDMSSDFRSGRVLPTTMKVSPAMHAWMKLFLVLFWLSTSLKASLLSQNVSLYYPTHHNPNCTNKFHDYDAVKRSAEKAKVLLSKHPSTKPIRERMLFMILFSKGFTNNDFGVTYLKCALNKLKAHMMPTNTIDIFIWVPSLQGMPDWISTIPRVNVMEIEPSTWLVPCGLVHDSRWALRHRVNYDYYLMGRWRLTFSFDFAREMGYAYHMQYDDDTILNSPVKYDITRGLLRGRYSMGVFSQPVDEIPDVLTGLPELTRYWLTVNDRKPVGPLFKHLVPPNIDGLTIDGWDKLYFRGYAIAMSVDFWFKPDVQDYLTTVLRLGRDIEGRWQEQAVINMIRLLFIPDGQLLRGAKVMDLGHDRLTNTNFYGWCVKGKFV